MNAAPSIDSGSIGKPLRVKGAVRRLPPSTRGAVQAALKRTAAARTATARIDYMPHP
jgi:hypothetical protein